MAIINFQCKKCEKEFDCETGNITFGDILGFEKELICPQCGKLSKDDIWLTEFGQTQIGDLYLSEEEQTKESKTNIEDKNVLDLCNKYGTGLDVINDINRALFYPLLFGIEETIYLHYKKDNSLRDLEVVESLKKIRDSIYSKNGEYNMLEKEIINKVKRVLCLNSYSKKDVSMSISKVLNSVKLHRYLQGKKGYLNFISEFFNQNIDNSGGHMTFSPEFSNKTISNESHITSEIVYKEES